MSQRIIHEVVELTGSAQQLTIDGDPRIRKISLTPGPSNAGPVYVGGDNTVSATIWGIRLPTPIDSIPPAPYEEGEFYDGSMVPSAYWLFGSAGDKVHVKILMHTPATRWVR